MESTTRETAPARPARARDPVPRRDPPHPRGDPRGHRARRRPLPVRPRARRVGGRRRDRRPLDVRRPRVGRRSSSARSPPAPAAYTLAARDPARDLPLDGRHVHLATDGCGIEVLDPWTLTVRRSALQDVADIARVADALPAIAFHWVAVSAQDRPPETRSLEEVAAVWRNSTKHVQTESIVTPEEAASAIEMAAAIAGGRAALRDATGPLAHAVHDQPARPRRRRPGRGARRRRGRRSRSGS